MTQYPNLYAGQDLTSTLLTSMIPQFAYVPTATTRASNTSITADPYLTLPVNSGSVYVVEFHLMFTGIYGVGINTQWLVPNGTTGSRTCVGPAWNADDSAGNESEGTFGAFLYSTSVNYSAARGGTGSPNTVLESSQFVAGSTGNVALGWGQNVSNATGISMWPGSWMRCTQIG